MPSARHSLCLLSGCSSEDPYGISVVDAGGMVRLHVRVCGLETSAWVLGIRYPSQFAGFIVAASAAVVAICSLLWYRRR